MTDHRIRIRRVVSSAVVIAAVASTPVTRMSSERPRPTADQHARAHRAASLHLPMRFDPSLDGAAGGTDFIARGPGYAGASRAHRRSTPDSPAPCCAAETGRTRGRPSAFSERR